MMKKTEFNRRAFCLTLGATGAAMLFSNGGQAASADSAAAAGGSHFPPIIGNLTTYTAKHEDTFADLARKFRLGYTELVAANPGVDPWVPGEGTKLTLPSWHILPNAPREGIVINLADQRLYYFRKNGLVETAPLGIGDNGWDTPMGKTKVVRKKANPNWYVPKSIRAENPELPAVVKAGPENPLGAHAIYLGWPAYLLHGTNKPDGVGRRVSHGCIRMYPEDVAHFFKEVPIGTPVLVMDDPLKVTRFGGRVWIEVAPDQAQADELEMTGKLTPAKPAEFEHKVIAGAGEDQQKIDWKAAFRAARERKGVPVAITPAPKMHQEKIPQAIPQTAEEET